MTDNNMPKKNPFSMQLDLSKFEYASDEEKVQQDRMRESASFFKDGMRKLRRNPVAMVCLVIVVLLVLIAFIVPIFYPYEYATSSASTGSISSNFLAPMEYSTKEQIVMSDNAVFLGWAYPNTANSQYKGLNVIESEEDLEAVKDLLVTAPITVQNGNIELYAVWGVDNDGDGTADFGAELFDFEAVNTVSDTFTVSYDIGEAEGEAPVDSNGYVNGDRAAFYALPADVTLEGAVFAGWTLRDDMPLLTADNFEEYQSDIIISKKFDVDGDLVFYAAWAADEDGDGAADGFKLKKFSYSSPKSSGYRVTYNMNLGEGVKPDDMAGLMPGDIFTPPSEVNFTKIHKNVFPHLLGTDEIGRDYATRVIVGMRISLLVGIIAAIIVVIIGVLYGAISGYFGGRVDLVMMRIVDIIYSLPDTLIIILLSVSLKDVIMNSSFNAVASKLGGVGLVSILIVFALLYWVGMARLVRGQVLSLREQEFVLAAKTMGVSPIKIILKHMLPNCISVIFISAALQIPSAIFTESTLSYLGVGVSIPMPSLGSLASDYRGQMTIPGREYLFIIPAIIIFLVVLSLNLLGQGLRDAFDPKLREVGK